ncbi:glycosyltransferase family 2 protein [Zeaxanthinibacter enoshimensis]|uniref:Glycosyltransferase involved in cell wall biosynthesis n=1 Tax=Zeaxanthinibacter enoshimensis TaxID=392009 RepID=A0A4R6TV06_9FLAO|nr:glycosyltransferase family 2 protein [Zeaxanthinibacter enoshimensis]TDQ32768.1 glycosyltransferase involved in cell wall biosynthesis [Zeaxanthinibacter enoshimensis]
MVSVITPVHNSEKFIRQCVESVQNQFYKEWEHILVDDCSEDRSVEIIQEYARKDQRIRLIQLDQNSGAGVARNKGIAEAKGSYIAFLDSDDQWYPEKLEKQITFMQNNKYHFSFTSYDTIDEKGNKLGQLFKARQRVTYNTALFKNPIGCLTAMYDVNFFGKQYMPEIRKRQDYALWLKLLKKADGYGLQEVLSSYRHTSNSISSGKIGLLKYEWKIYREIEGLSFLQSSFYLLSAVFMKLRTYIK